jgi:hypothetical protein
MNIPMARKEKAFFSSSGPIAAMGHNFSLGGEKGEGGTKRNGVPIHLRCILKLLKGNSRSGYMHEEQVEIQNLSIY